MKYNFDAIVPRRGTNSYKWDTTEQDVLPLWVADMDFHTAPPIVQALHRRVGHAIFGYTHVPHAYYQAIINWFGSRHGLTIQQEWIVYTTGVVPALSAIIRALTQPGDKVLIQTPVYNCFFSSILNNGCSIESNPLLYQDNTYQIDFNDLERQASDPNVKLLLLCNPHNPVGRVWNRNELQRMGEICFRNHVKVIADEIHGELVYPGHTYTPFASISNEHRRNSITCISPSKAFNLAGLQIANIVVADPIIRSKIERAININEVCDVNPFGIEALIAAYNSGEEWLEELKRYLWRNCNFLKDYLNEHLPQLKTIVPEGSYLVWIDCRALKRSSKEITTSLLQKGRIRVNEGTLYGEAGEGFIRINVACPKEQLLEGLQRLTSVLKTYDDE